MIDASAKSRGIHKPLFSCSEVFVLLLLFGTCRTSAVESRQQPADHHAACPVRLVWCQGVHASFVMFNSKCTNSTTVVYVKLLFKNDRCCCYCLKSY